jgi:hypothetical protein
MAHLPAAGAETLRVGPIRFENTPTWFQARKAEKVIDRVQARLEWDLRPSTAVFHSDPEAFSRAHGLGGSVLAFAKKGSNVIYFGPQVDAAQFESTFAHELAHLIVGQKYKKAIPDWLEEGLANSVAGKDRIDYGWLFQQKRPRVRELAHPFRGSVDPRLHYLLSSATVAYLSSKCSFADLLQLSVGKGIEPFLATYCEIRDLDGEMEKFIAAQARVQK